MAQLTIYISADLIDKIERRINKIGCGATKSGWISDACREKLADKSDLATVIRTLENWYSTFPKKPFKEVLKEIKNGKI